MALINCPECDKEISDKATICINCGYPISSNEFTVTQDPHISDTPATLSLTKKTELKQSVKRKNMRKISFLSLISLIVVAIIVIAVILYVQSTPNYRLKNSHFVMAVDIFFEDFYGTNNELSAIEFLVSAIEEPAQPTFDWESSSDWLEWVGVDILVNGRDSEYSKFQDFFRVAHELLLNDTTQKWSVFFSNVERLSNIITPLKDIYANLQSYYGQIVVVTGVLDRNDIRRGVITIDSNYPLPIRYKITLNDRIRYLDEKWEDTDRRLNIIAEGVLNQITDSEGVFLLPVQMDIIAEADLSQYTGSMTLSEMNLRLWEVWER